MNTAQMVFVGIVFVTAVMVAMMLFNYVASGDMRRRLASVSGARAYADGEDAKKWRKMAIKVSGTFAKLSLPEEGWETSPLRIRFMNAGYRGESGLMLYFSAKTLLAVVPPLVLFTVLRLSGSNMSTLYMLALLLIVAATGYYLPNVILERLVFYRQRSVFENFPDAADLMLVCVESGMGLDAALNKVADEIRLKSEALAEELQLVNLEIRAGSTREKSLRNLALRTGVEEVNMFATMLIQADRFGTSIGDSLRVFSDSLRTRRRFRAEELAAKIPLKLLFPLVFFIFPSLLLVLLGPAFIQVYRIMLPTLAGLK